MVSRGEGREVEQETIPARLCCGLSVELLGYDFEEFDLEY